MATIYINADTGDNGVGDGSSDNPYETLAYAFDQASDEDTIICQDSTATYELVNITFDHTITIRGESDDASGAVFDAGGNSFAWTVEASFALEKVTLQNVVYGTASGVYINALGTFNFNNCVFKDIYSDTGYAYLAGIIETRRDVGNVVGAGTISISVNSCLFYDFGNANSSRKSRVINIGRNNSGSNVSSIVSIICCTFFNDKSSDLSPDIFVFHDNNNTGSELTTKNCIFRDVTEVVDSINSGSPTEDISHNCYSGATDEGGVGSISSDPLFVDEDNDNFNLRPVSPCINTGALI